MSRNTYLFVDRMFAVTFAWLAAFNFDTGNHFWLALWSVFTILAIIDYAYDATRPWPTKKAAK
jgi:hypothetical protein